MCMRERIESLGVNDHFRIINFLYISTYKLLKRKKTATRQGDKAMNKLYYLFICFEIIKKY